MDKWSLGNVVVTGAASGLGAAIAAAVQDSGGTPICLDLREPQLDIAHKIVDLSDTRAAQAAVEEVAQERGGISAVVTAAGTDACGMLEDVPADSWEKVIQVNLLGTAAVVRAALPFLRQTNGKVVTVASTLGLRALSDATAYCASKFAVVGFTRALAVEMAGRVGVTLLIPGGMHTAFFDARDDKYKPPADAKLNRPEDVAAAVIFALRQPAGCEVRELVITPSMESSWP